jgi:phage recombination protein Bet
METKELMLLNSIDFDNAKVVATLKATVAQGLTDAEFLLFAEHCKSTRLNPFKRDVWAIKVNGRLQLMTGINGYWTTANRHDQFDGYEEGYISKDGQELPDTYAGNDYIGAWCKVHRKDRKMPAKGVAFMAEYNKGHGNWKTMPRVMIMKCAESIALRKAFPQELNGTYTAEEMPREYEPPKDDGGNSGAPAVVIADELPQPKEKTIHDRIIDRNTDRWNEEREKQWTGDDVMDFGKHKGKKWSEVSADYIEWLFQNTKGEKAIKAGFEIHRREEAQQGIFNNINEQAEQALNIDTDEIPAEFTTNKEA